MSLPGLTVDAFTDIGTSIATPNAADIILELIITVTLRFTCPTWDHGQSGDSNLIHVNLHGGAIRIIALDRICLRFATTKLICIGICLNSKNFLHDSG